MKFHQRVKVARLYGGFTQAGLSRLLSGNPDANNSLLDRLENREDGEGSVYTTQIAYHCKVNPYWLAMGIGEMVLDKTTMSDAAATVGLAWEHVKSPAREQLALDVLSTALQMMPDDHTLRREFERLQRDMSRRRQIQSDLKERPVASSRAPKRQKVEQ